MMSIAGDPMGRDEQPVTLDAQALRALREYLGFIEARAEAMAQRDATLAERSDDLRDIKNATAAALGRLSGRRYPVVLVVDDEPAIHQLARRVLEPEGYDVLSESDGPAALLALGATRVHVALCDVHMPGPSGVWLAQRIRDAFPTTAIVFLTGDQSLRPTEKLGPAVVGYVLKPFRRETLVCAVREGVRFANARAREAPDT
jgi:CheY-like chemotaxis protein